MDWKKNSIVGLILTLIVMMCLFFFDSRIFYTKHKVDKANVITISVLFLFAFIGLGVEFIPLLSHVKNLFHEMQFVLFFCIYTIFIFLLFINLSQKQLTNYGNVFTLMSILAVVLVSYGLYNSSSPASTSLSSTASLLSTIKMSLLFMCLIFLYIMHYIITPIQIVSTKLSMTAIAWLIAVFLYLTSTLFDDTVIYSISTPIAKISILLFVLFFLIFGTLFYFYPTGIGNANNPQITLITTLFLFLIAMLWIFFIFDNLTLMPNVNGKNMYNSKKLIIKYIQILFGSYAVITFLIWFITLMVDWGVKSDSSSSSSIVAWILLAIGVLIAIYKIMSRKQQQPNKYVAMLKKWILEFGKLFVGTTRSDLSLLLFSSVLFSSYFVVPIVWKKTLSLLIGGHVLISEAKQLSSRISLGNYQQLTGKNTYDYQYGISFWIYIDSFPPNNRHMHSEYCSIFDYGGKPLIEYNYLTRSLVLSVKNKKQNSRRVLYSEVDVLPIQKWNNIIINYHGGTLDLFVNDKLLSSSNEIVPYYTLDALTVGQENGLSAGINTMIYYDHPLSSIKRALVNWMGA